MESFLGKFYFKKYNNKPPTFIQIIGWTPNAENDTCIRKYVYIRKIPYIINTQTKMWTINYNIINNYKNLQKPVRKIPRSTQYGLAILIKNGNYLRFQSETIPILKFI
jgi:hypothetical protein